MWGPSSSRKEKTDIEILGPEVPRCWPQGQIWSSISSTALRRRRMHCTATATAKALTQTCFCQVGAAQRQVAIGAPQAQQQPLRLGRQQTQPGHIPARMGLHRAGPHGRHHPVHALQVPLLSLQPSQASKLSTCPLLMHSDRRLRVWTFCSLRSSCRLCSAMDLGDLSPTPLVYDKGYRWHSLCHDLRAVGVQRCWRGGQGGHAQHQGCVHVCSGGRRWHAGAQRAR